MRAPIADGQNTKHAPFARGIDIQVYGCVIYHDEECAYWEPAGAPSASAGVSSCNTTLPPSDWLAALLS